MQGKGNRPNKAKPMSKLDQDKLWGNRALGKHSPIALLNTVWFFNTKLFGFRGSHESRQLLWGDITLKKDSDTGDEYLEFNERLSKTRQGNTTHLRAFAPKQFPNKNDPCRCPVLTFKFYAEKRPAEINLP